MATVHPARLIAGVGSGASPGAYVTRLVAAKRLHPHFTDDPEFVAMFHDEARIASRIHHPNVVPVLDVITEGEEVILVQEYVHGVPLNHLFRLAHHSQPMPVAIGAAIIAGVLAGLHAAHEATDEMGEPLGVVHRDVSPQNIIVSVDGIPRLLDFGIAKAKTSVHHTREGFFKGKLAYMSPEQLRSDPITRQVDIYAAGVLLWEVLVNRRFYDGKNDGEFARTILVGSTPSPVQALEAQRASGAISIERWADIERLNPIVMRALSTNPENRYETAVEMAAAIFAAVRTAPSSEVSTFVRALGSEYLDRRQKTLVANEETWRAGGGANGANTSPTSAKYLVDTTSDESVKSSGARVRLANEDQRATEPALLESTSGGNSGFSGLSSLNLSSGSLTLAAARGDVVEKRAIVPWTVVAGLLVIVGLLTGMVLVREPSAGKDGAGNAAAAAAGGQGPPVTPTPLVPPPLPTIDQQETASAGSGVRTPPSVVTIVRYAPAPPPPRVVAPPPPRALSPAPQPSPIPTPVPSSRTADCNPPFYYEGSKKIFKPNCL